MAVTPTWSVAVTAKAPPVLMKAYVAHHRRLGASEIIIFFDDPADESYALLRGHPGVQAIACDKAHWARVGTRPPTLFHRQLVNVNLARAVSKAQWLIHLDTDEFLQGDEPIADALARVPQDVEAARVLPWENMFTAPPQSFADVFAGPFKHRIQTMGDGIYALGRLYGPHAQYLGFGLQGHSIGKTFVRLASGCRMTVHEAFAGEERVIPWQLRSVRMLHFFVWGYHHWCGKFLRQLDPTTFRTLKDGMSRDRLLLFARTAAQGEAALLQLFDTYNLLTPAGEDVLKRMDCLLRHDLGLAQAIEEEFGSADHGLRAALPQMSFAHIRSTLEAYARQGI